MKQKNKLGSLGRKLGMTQIFRESGEMIPVTALQVGPCQVTQVKTEEKDGYQAVQLGFDQVKHEKLTRAERGHFSKAGTQAHRHLREFRGDEVATLTLGQTLGAELYQVGDKLNISAHTKGKGFQGVIKRHGKAGGPAAHGSHFHRSTGSIGQRSYPGKVFKNMKLPGQMGNVRVTIQNLEVVEVSADNNIVFVKGAVPGATGSLLYIRNNSPKINERLKVAS